MTRQRVFILRIIFIWKIFSIFAENIFQLMVIIKTNNGYYLDLEDSIWYVKYVLQEQFDNFSDFLNYEEIKVSDYWGDICLLGTEDEYREWITKIARQLLKE
jgi:hypothetical protein